MTFAKELKAGMRVYEARCHYRRFDDEASDPILTLAEAKATALEMVAARDPAHADRSDIGWSVVAGTVAKVGGGDHEIDWAGRVAGAGYAGK